MKKSDKISYSFKIYDDLGEIMKFIHIGTHLPIWPDLYKYIKCDINHFKAKLHILLEFGYIAGCVLTFKFKNILYFGYFNVLDNKTEKINLLIDRLIQIGKNSDCKSIIGPINIPAIIYGWGFLNWSLIDSLTIASPINPLNYPKLFNEKGFTVRFKDFTWDPTKFFHLNGSSKSRYKFKDYEYINIKDKNEFLNIRQDFIKLQVENLPQSARITPDSINVIGNYIDFVFEQGYSSMIFYIKYKPDNKMIASGAFLPDIFRREKGKIKSTVVYTWAIDPDHRRKGLSLLMYDVTMSELSRLGITHYTSRIGSENVSSSKVAKILNGIHTRTHALLEYRL